MITKVESIATLSVAGLQYILGILITVYTIENHHIEFPALSENAVWIDCINFSHENSYKPSLNMHIVEYCRSTIHPGGINQTTHVPVHDNIYFFQYIDHYHIPFSILTGTLICLWSGIWHTIFALPYFISSIKIHQKWYWSEHVVPTGLITVSLLYFSGQHNLPLLLNYAVIMMIVTSFPTFYNKSNISITILFVLVYFYVVINVIFYTSATLNRSSDNFQWYLLAQFIVGILVFSPFPSVFFLEKKIHIWLKNKFDEEEDEIEEVGISTPARYVHYIYSGLIRSIYIILLFSTIYTKTPSK